MKTALMLFARHEKALLSLDDISQEYFGLSPTEARRAVAKGELGVKAVQLRSSSKAPWLVHIDDLATYVDKLRQREA